MDFPFAGDQAVLAPSNGQNSPTGGVSNWTQECRKRVEAFESAQQKARQWEAYFSNFLYSQQQLQQPMSATQTEEFRRYLNDYKACWTSCQALDPRTLLVMFREMECCLMQARDELSAFLTKWKNDQALAQIGRPSNAHELQPIALRFSKLDNKICDAIGLIKRFHRFVEERFQQSHLTELGQFWQGAMQECVLLVSRMAAFRRELQRESFLPFEQPPYIVRRFAGKAKATERGEENWSGPGSGDEESTDFGFDDGQLDAKFPKQTSRVRGQTHRDQNNNGDQSSGRTVSAAKECKKEHKVVFDLRVRLMVGDKSHIGDSTKVHAVLLTDQQCRELVNRQLTAYDDPLAALSEIGPPLIAAASGKAATKRKVAAARRRTPCLPGTPPFAAGQLTPHDACLTYDSGLEHFEAFFQNMKVNEKDRNPEADAQARFYRILFVTKLKDWDSKDFYLWCLSVPFPIVVNATRQERSTSAKIFCHLASTAAVDSVDSRPSQPPRVQSPTSPPTFPHCPSASGEHRYLPWSDFFDRLNWWWLKQTGAKVGLHAHELYLASKLGLMGNPDEFVALEQVTKKYDNLDFSFWDWLFMIADYVKRNRHYWDSGFIFGFVSKEEINRYLARAKEPVMFIRFSDSMPGSLVISYGMAGREPQHIILHQKSELKQHKLTFFIQQSKQLLNVNYISTSMNPAVGLKPKSEFLKIETTTPSQVDDDAEAMSRRGYTRPKLTFDWSEPPPSFRDEEQDDESTCTSITFQDFLQDSDFFNKDTSPYGYEDLTAADPNGFSTALVPASQASSSPPQPSMNGNSAWNGHYADVASLGSPAGTMPSMSLANL